MQQTLVVLLFQVRNLLTHHAEVLKETLLALAVLAGDVGLAKHHQVVDVVAGIVDKSSDRTVSDLFVCNDNGTHVQVHQFLHIFHLHVHRQLHATEDCRHHLGTDIVMVVESPALDVVPPLALRFADIVHQCSPTKPETMVVEML